MKYKLQIIGDPIAAKAALKTNRPIKTGDMIEIGSFAAMREMGARYPKLFSLHVEEDTKPVAEEVEKDLDENGTEFVPCEEHEEDIPEEKTEEKPEEKPEEEKGKKKSLKKKKSKQLKKDEIDNFVDK